MEATVAIDDVVAFEERAEMGLFDTGTTVDVADHVEITDI